MRTAHLPWASPKHQAVRLVSRRVQRSRGRICRAPRIVAFKTEPELSYTLPLDYFKCLGIARGTSKDNIRRACDRLLQSPPEVGYSEQALLSRATLLQTATECLSDLGSRKAYEAQGRTAGFAVDVGPAEFAGALALLQESGAADAVIENGEAWMKGNGNSGYTEHRDVAAAVALAHLDLAAAALEQSADAEVAPAVVHLQSAGALLKCHALSSDLRDDIQHTLEV